MKTHMLIIPVVDNVNVLCIKAIEHKEEDECQMKMMFSSKTDSSVCQEKVEKKKNAVQCK